MHIKIRDNRLKEKYKIDDEYLNGYARLCGVYSTAVYNSLCRHADNKQECFPSVRLIATQHKISERTVVRAVNKLEEYHIIRKEKTRRKNGKWLNNLYVLRDKSEWLNKPKKVSQVPHSHLVKKPSQVTLTTQPSDSDDISQVTQGHTKDTHVKDTHKKVILHSKTSFAGSDLNSLLELFKPINPSYERLYSNTTQRGALERLVKKYSVKKIKEILKALPKLVVKPFCPQISTPYQLETKLGNLISFYNQSQNKQPKITKL